MTDLWQGQFGNDYTTRQMANVDDRREFWRGIIPRHVTSILEVGANVGLNLEAIEKFSNADLFASEPNEEACKVLARAGIDANKEFAHELSWNTGQFVLVFTCGVLIHIPTDKLLPSMREIYRVSRQWIICAEYFAPQEEMIPYRGHDNALWRRDYGSIWLDNFPDLRCHSCQFAWKRTTGMDNITVWIMEKCN